MSDPGKVKVIRYLAERNARIDARITIIIKEQVDRVIDSMELQMIGIKP